MKVFNLSLTCLLSMSEKFKYYVKVDLKYYLLKGVAEKRVT